MVLFSADKSLRIAALWLREDRKFIEYTQLDDAETNYRREQTSGNDLHPNRNRLVTGAQTKFDALTNRGLLIPGGQIGESRRLIDVTGNTIIESSPFSYAVFERPSPSSNLYFVNEMYSGNATTHLMSLDDFQSVSIPYPTGFKKRVFPNSTFRMAFQFADGFQIYTLEKDGSWTKSVYVFPENWIYKVDSSIFVNNGTETGRKRDGNGDRSSYRNRSRGTETGTGPVTEANR